MIDLNVYRKRIGCFNNQCTKEKKALLEKSSLRNVFLREPVNPLHVFLCLLYVYFITLTYTCFATHILEFPPFYMSSRVGYSPLKDHVSNVNFHNLITLFNLTITVFIIRRALQNHKYRNIVYSKLD